MMTGTGRDGAGEVLGVILARGGSRGIPRKNLRLLGGVPLVERGVRILLPVTPIRRVMVSTEDPEIARVAANAGAEIPFLRPAELARDDTPSRDALVHLVSKIAERGPIEGVTCLYQATSPCVTPDQIEDAIALFHAHNANSLKSVTPVRDYPHWMGRIDGERFHYIVEPEERPSRRQDVAPLYCLNGAISIYRTATLLEGQGEEEDPLPFVMDRDSSIDIDDHEDWKEAERILEEREGMLA
ncbi:MAG: cytidylyltransferase domain-containing protein [Planctomycetota bacterium]